MKRVLIQDGRVETLYDDATAESLLSRLGGKASIQRASHVEAPTKHLDRIEFTVDLAPSQGPMLEGFPSYKAAVSAEIDWINENRLNPSRKQTQAATRPTNLPAQRG